MCSENFENFSWDLEDRGDYRVIEDDKEQQFLSSQKSQGKLTRGSHLNSRISNVFPLKPNPSHIWDKAVFTSDLESKNHPVLQPPQIGTEAIGSPNSSVWRRGMGSWRSQLELCSHSFPCKNKPFKFCSSCNIFRCGPFNKAGWQQSGQVRN